MFLGQEQTLCKDDAESFVRWRGAVYWTRCVSSHHRHWTQETKPSCVVSWFLVSPGTLISVHFFQTRQYSA